VTEKLPGHISLVNSLPIYCSDLFFKMGKTAQICCIYMCEKNSAARPDPAHDADPGIIL
jgi:hypothetical protein